MQLITGLQQPAQSTLEHATDIDGLRRAYQAGGQALVGDT